MQSDRLTILVVEDEPFILLDVACHLEECGFNVLQAGDARTALQIVADTEEIDLLFTDIRMPGALDGLDLAKWVISNRSEIAILITSGDLGKVANMNDLSAARILPKPYDVARLATRILEVIAQKKVAQHRH